MYGSALSALAARARARNSGTRRILPLLALLCVQLLAGCTDASPTGPTEPPAELPAAVREYVALVNQHRASIGCGPLTWHAKAAGVAQRHSEDMVRRNFFSHVNPDGDSPKERLIAGRVAFYRAGENLARGQTSGAEVLGAWLGSPAHRANIETCGFTQHGLGIYQNHWTHVFIRP